MSDSNPDTASSGFEAAPRPSLSQRARGLTGAGAPYLTGLNPEQREAVETLDGPLLVLAGAGTGKTRVLTTRLAHLLSTGKARSFQILSVTFTNKAAREMRERVEALLGPGGGAIQWLGTFHSISAQILRRHAELVGLKPNFTILDDDDQERLLKQLIEADGLDPKRWSAKLMSALIDTWKNKALTPEKLDKKDAFSFGDGKAIKLYSDYQERLKVLNCCDFGDLILHVIELLRKDTGLLAQYHERFRYILVDEYQDTNIAQYLWLRLFAQGSSNICVVGDDDQSIYGWRGAEVDNILRFERDFPGAKVIRLERNYRSTANILAAASGLIAANQARLGKTLRTEGAPGDTVKVRGVWDGEQEARLIADDIEAWRVQGRRYSDCAVLVRASWQMRAFEERFILTGLPYRVIGGPRFFERAEIRDAHAYLRLIRSPDDDLAFERVVNQPKRGIGDTSVKKLQILARSRGAPLAHAAEMAMGSDELTGPAKRGIVTFLNDLARWRTLAQEIRHDRLMETVLEESGYTDMLQADKSAQSAGRLENLKELVQAMGQFDTLEAYLEHVELVMDVEREAADDAVQILTLHAAKGLEWPLVFLPGWEDTVFPSQRAVEESGLKGLEEERRLAYVGLTRAKESARISFAANRQVFGRWQNLPPSRFIDELPEGPVEAVSETGWNRPDPRTGAVLSDWGPAAYDAGAGFRSTYDSPGWRRAREQGGFDSAGAPAKRSPPPMIEASARLVASSDSGQSRYRIGERVFHLKFGYGQIRAVEGNKLTILFDKAGEKRVIDDFVKPASAA